MDEEALDETTAGFKPGDEVPKFSVGDKVLYTSVGCTVGLHAGPGFKKSYEGRMMVVSRVFSRVRYYVSPTETKSRWRYQLADGPIACLEFLKPAAISSKEDMEALYG